MLPRRVVVTQPDLLLSSLQVLAVQRIRGFEDDAVGLEIKEMDSVMMESSSSVLLV
jgi:hypothetical protein